MSEEMSRQTRIHSSRHQPWHPQRPRARHADVHTDMATSSVVSSETWGCPHKPTARHSTRRRRHLGGHLRVSAWCPAKHSDVPRDVHVNMFLKWKPPKTLLTWHATSLFPEYTSFFPVSTSDFPGSTSDFRPAPSSCGGTTSSSTSPLERMKFVAMWHCPSGCRWCVVRRGTDVSHIFCLPTSRLDARAPVARGCFWRCLSFVFTVSRMFSCPHDVLGDVYTFFQTSFETSPKTRVSYSVANCLKSVGYRLCKRSAIRTFATPFGKCTYCIARWTMEKKSGPISGQRH